LIDVNVSMWFEVLVEKTCLSRSTRWKGLVYLVHYRDPGQTYGKPTNRTISFVSVGMIGLFVGVTSGTENGVRRQRASWTILAGSLTFFHFRKFSYRIKSLERPKDRRRGAASLEYDHAQLQSHIS
jgi:hypothetical protein